MKGEAVTVPLARLLPHRVAAAALLAGVLLGALILFVSAVVGGGNLAWSASGGVFITAWILVLVGYLWRSPAGRIILWASLGVTAATAVLWFGVIIMASLGYVS